MLIEQLLQRAGLNHGAIPVNDQKQPAQARELFLAAHHSMSGTQLLGLMDGPYARPFSHGANVFCLMAHHYEHTLGRHQPPDCCNGVLDQGFASRPVQHLGHTGLHTSSLSGRQDHNCGAIDRCLFDHEV